MSEINNTPMVNSSDLSKVVANPMMLSALTRALSQAERGQHKSLGAGRHPGSNSRGGGNDGVDISRNIVQGWLNDGKLQLRSEPTPNSVEAKLYGSPMEFLEKNGLKLPESK
jgi:hypothetical protein